MHLLAESLAIDAGIATLAPTTDLEGVPRPQGVAHDLGAYEHCTDCLIFSDGFEAGDTSAWSAGGRAPSSLVGRVVVKGASSTSD